MTTPAYGLVFNRDNTDPRPAQASDLSVIGLVLPSEDADATAFPLNEPIVLDSGDPAWLPKLGTGDLYKAISSHFALEERVMRERRYDALAEHKADHERLLDQLRDMMDAQADGAILDDAQFGGQLAEWFAGHFRTHDARFHGSLAR